MYCNANGCIDRPHKQADGLFEAWNELVGLLPASFAMCVVLIHIIWVLVRDLIQENVDLSFLLDDEDSAAQTGDIKGTLSSLLRTNSSMTQNASTSALDTNLDFKSTQTLDHVPSQTSQKNASFTGLTDHSSVTKQPQTVTASTHCPTDDAECSSKKSSQVVERSGHPVHQKFDSVTPESGSTTIYLADGLPLGRDTDSGQRRDSMTRWSVESGRRAPVGGLALSPPSRNPERSNGEGLSAATKVDRGCSPFRYSELSPLVAERQICVPASTWTSPKIMSPSRLRSSFAKTTAICSDVKTRTDRRVMPGNLGVHSTDLRLNLSPTCNFCNDYRRDALERQRHLQVVKSNRTLERFMRVLRQEKEAKATAALFAAKNTANCRCPQRQTPRMISFAEDEESRPVTLSGAGCSNICHGENSLAKSTVRCNSPSTKYFCQGQDRQRRHTGML